MEFNTSRTRGATKSVGCNRDTRVHAITIRSQLDAIAIHAVTATEGSPVDTWMQRERSIFIGRANQNDRLDRDRGPITK